MDIVKIRRYPDLHTTALTIPKKFMGNLEGANAMKVEEQDGKIVYTPLRE